ncbi:MAG: bifunctional oligoribonuclease/PAP phosphatase NrnA [Candidatus Omnitrophota bacterium]
MPLSKISKVFKDNKTFLIASHKNMEGDAIGSQLALASLLIYMKKNVYIYTSDDIPPMYNFLPFIELIKKYTGQKICKYDVACVVDCTDLDRVGSIVELIDKNKTIINIDHHISNAKFGNINWIRPQASSAAELIYELFKSEGVSIDQDSALNLYVAIMTDTGSFRYSNTRPKTHRIVADLLSKGVDPVSSYCNIYEKTSPDKILLLSEVLSSLSVAKEGKVAWVKVANSQFKKYGLVKEAVDDFVNYPRSVEGVKVAICLREIKKNFVKVNFRSDGEVDVNKLANIFGGGGHASASGCVLNCDLDSAEKMVIKEAKKMV